MSAFNIVAALQVQAPKNLGSVVNDIQRQLSSVTANINVQLSGQGTASINQLGASLNQLNRNLSDVQRQSQATSASFGQISGASQNVSRGVSQSATSIDSLTASLRSNANALNQNVDFLENFGRSAGLAAKRYSAFLLAGGAIITFTSNLRSGISEAIEFESSLIKLAQVADDSRSTIAGVGAEVTRLATTYGVSSKALLESAVTLRQAGISANETRVALEALAKTQLAPSFDNLSKTTEGLIAVMAQFGLQARDAEGALGSINAVAANFAVESKDLIEVISRVGGQFRASGGDVQQLLALFTSVRATTRESAESIATGLRTIFARLQRTDTVDALRDLGINLRHTREEALQLGNVNLTDQFVGTYQAIQRVSQGIRQIQTTDPRFSGIIEQLGGYRQISRVIPLLQQTTLAQQAYNVAQAGGASLTVNAGQAQEGLANRLSKLKEEFLDLIRVVSSSQTFKEFANVALSLASAFIQVTKALTPLLPLIGGLAALKIGFSLPSVARGVTAGLGLGAAPATAVPRFARGGVVPGHGNGDTVPAYLEPGEFVIRQQAARSIGYDNLHRANDTANGQGLATGGSVKGKPQGFASGGIIRINPPGGRVGILTSETGASDSTYTIVGDKRSLNQDTLAKFKRKNNVNLDGIESFAVNARTTVPFNKSKAADFKSKFEGSVSSVIENLSNEFFNPPGSFNKSQSDTIIKTVLTNQGLGRIFESALQTSLSKKVNQDIGANFDFVPPNSKGLSSFIGSGIYADAKYRDTYEGRISVLRKALTAVTNGSDGFTYSNVFETNTKRESLNKLGRESGGTSRSGKRASSLAMGKFNEQYLDSENRGIRRASGGEIPVFKLNSEAIKRVLADIEKVTGIKSSDLISNVSVRKNLLDAKGNVASNRSGSFNLKTKNVSLSSSLIRSEADLRQVLAHELGHSIDNRLGGDNLLSRTEGSLTNQFGNLYVDRLRSKDSSRGFTSKKPGYRYSAEEGFANLFSEYVNNESSRKNLDKRGFGKNILSSLVSSKISRDSQLGVSNVNRGFFGKLAGVFGFAEGGLLSKLPRSQRLSVNSLLEQLKNHYYDEADAKRIADNLSRTRSLDYIHKDSTVLGSGVAAIGFRTPEGDVIRAQSLRQTIQAVKDRVPTSIVSPNYINHPDILQPTDSKTIGKGLNEAYLSRLPFLENADKDVHEGIAKLKERFEKHGLEFLDDHAGNVGRTPDGRYLVRDPGAVSDPYQRFSKRDASSTLEKVLNGLSNYTANIGKQTRVNTIRGFAAGGQSTDTVPALLTPGEFVLNKEAVGRIGLSNLHHANSSGDGSRIQRFARGGHVKHFVTGNQVDSSTSTVNDDGSHTVSLSDLTRFSRQIGLTAGEFSTLLSSIRKSVTEFDGLTQVIVKVNEQGSASFAGVVKPDTNPKINLNKPFTYQVPQSVLFNQPIQPTASQSLAGKIDTNIYNELNKRGGKDNVSDQTRIQIASQALVRIRQQEITELEKEYSITRATVPLVERQRIAQETIDKRLEEIKSQVEAQAQAKNGGRPIGTLGEAFAGRDAGAAAPPLRFRDRALNFATGNGALLAASAITYGSSFIDQGSAEDAVNGGSRIGFQGKRSVGGATTGLGIGVGLAGSAALAAPALAAGPFGIPIGAAIILGSALIGAASSAHAAGEEFDKAKLEISRTNLNQALSDVGSGARGINASSVNEIRSNLQGSQSDYATRILAIPRGLSGEALDSARRTASQEAFGRSGSQAAAFLNRQAVETARSQTSSIQAAPVADLNEQLRSLTATFEESNGGLTRTFVELQARLRNIPYEEALRSFVEVINAERNNIRSASAQQAVNNVNRQFDGLVVALQAATLHLDDFSGQLAGSAAAQSGQISGGRNRNQAAGLNSIDQNQFLESARSIAAPFGAAGSNFLQGASSANDVRRAVISSLGEATASGPAGHEGYSQQFATLLNARLPANGRNEVTTTFIQSAIQSLASQSGTTEKFRELQQNLQVNPEKVVEELIGPFARPLIERGNEIARSQQAASDAFVHGLVQAANGLQRASEAFDRARNLTSQAFRAQLEVRSGAEFRNVTLATPLAQLEAPLRQRQEELTGDYRFSNTTVNGLPQGQAFNSQAIGQRIIDLDASRRGLQGELSRTPQLTPRYDELQEQIVAISGATRNFQEALTNAGNAAARLAATDERLAQIRQREEAGKNLTERFLTGDSSARFALNRGQALAIQANQRGGDISNLLPNQVRELFDFLRTAGQGRAAGDRTGEELRSLITQRAAGQLGNQFVAANDVAGLAGERQGLEGNRVAVFGAAAAAAGEAGRVAQTISGRDLSTTQDANTRAISELTTQLRSLEVSFRESRIVSLNAQLDPLRNQETQLSSLNSISTTGQISDRQIQVLRGNGVQEALRTFARVNDENRNSSNLVTSDSFGQNVSNFVTNTTNGGFNGNISTSARGFSSGSVGAGNRAASNSLNDFLINQGITDPSLITSIRTNYNAGVNNLRRVRPDGSIIPAGTVAGPEIQDPRTISSLLTRSIIESVAVFNSNRENTASTSASSQLGNLLNGQNININSLLGTALTERGLASFNSSLQTFNQEGSIDRFREAINSLTRQITDARTGEDNSRFVGPRQSLLQGLATGGSVASFAGPSPFASRGSDTVPAMLTPGEFVVNREATSRHRDLLHSINDGKAIYLAAGDEVRETTQQTLQRIRREREAASQASRERQNDLLRTARNNPNNPFSPISEANARRQSEESLIDSRENAFVSESAAVAELIQRARLNPNNPNNLQQEENRRQQANADLAAIRDRNNQLAGPRLQALFNRRPQAALTPEQRLARIPGSINNLTNVFKAEGAISAGEASFNAQRSILNAGETRRSIAAGLSSLSIGRRPSNAFLQEFTSNTGQRERIGQLQENFRQFRANQPANNNFDRGLIQGGFYRFAAGGHVPGTGLPDTVPAYLSHGEFVLNKQATDTLGVNNLRYFNSGGYVKYLQNGGDATTNVVPQAVSSPTTAQVNTQSVQNTQLNFNGFIQAVNTFNNGADKLAGALAKIPTSIELTGTHNVNVNILGAEVFATLEPAVKNLIQSSVAKALNNVISTKFSESGVSRLNAAEQSNLFEGA